MARPTDYSPEILKEARKYLKVYKKEGDTIPSIEGLSCFIGIARSTIYVWASQADKGEFADIIDELLSTQGRVLLNGGLAGRLNPVISKVILSKHGYREGTDITDESAKKMIDELREEVRKITT